MNVVSVIASPRKNGNCKHIEDIFTEVIEENNGHNTVYFVEDMKIRGCQACRACKSFEKPTMCVLDDDFNSIMKKVSESDAFIFACPNYFGEICGQGRVFMDRFYSMTKTTPNQLKNNPKCVVIHTYGAREGHYDEYITRKARVFNSIGCELVKILSIGENKPTRGDSSRLIEEVRMTAQELVGEK